MRQSAVGQKCPRCAAVPRSARALGKPSQYVKGTAAGLAVAVAGGLLVNAALGAAGFGTILLPGLLGFGVGRAVSWGAAGQSSHPFAILAVTLAVIGALLALGGPLALVGPFRLLGLVAAGWFALRGLRS
jgi:hypothetical protein